MAMRRSAAALVSVLLVVGSIGQSHNSFAGVGFAAGPIVEIITELTSTAEEVDTQTTRVEISLNQHRATLYRGETEIKSYAIAVGREGWETPVGEFHVFQMVMDPNWKHPVTGRIFKSGEPGNALGHYWIGFWTDGDTSIGFHGTPHRKSVGKASSHGCIRMYDQDVEELFSRLRLGTLVRVVP
jgi:lipoprotein-anchoring transpeptidase ErfK/SrfK